MQSYTDGHETIYNKEIQSKYDSLSEDDKEMLQEMIEKKRESRRESRRESLGGIETFIKKIDSERNHSEKKASILDIEEENEKGKEDQKEDPKETNESSTKKTIRF